MTHRPPSSRTWPACGPVARAVLTGLILAFLGTAVWFRLMRLSSVPGISGDEGWWGIQATAWLAGQPFERHTTSGNPIDLFFLIPVAIVHAIAPPSFLLLRAVPALVNLIALPVGFWLVRRVYGSPTAWIQTVGLAILPTAIAHSRICQDPSQTVFWTGILIYLSLLGLKEYHRARVYAVAVLLVFPVVLWTHPTNVFVAPFLLLPCAAAIRPVLTALSPRARVGVLGGAALVVAAASFVVWSVAMRVGPSVGYLDKPWLSMAAARMFDVAQWFEFAANNARLFNGVTIYHYFSGARPWTVPYDGLFVVVAATLLVGLVLGPSIRHRPEDVGLLLACAATWIAFYAIAGPEALRPHFERWGLCLLVPGTLVMARGLATWIEWRPRIRWLTIALASGIAAGLLATFYLNYFREFATTGGRSHLTYVTASVEPKRQAFGYILERTPGSGPLMIVAQQWWIARPIGYLALDHPNVSIATSLDAEREPIFQEAAASGRLFFVEFAGTPELTAATDWIRARGLHAARTPVADASGRELLVVLQIAVR